MMAIIPESRSTGNSCAQAVHIRRSRNHSFVMTAKETIKLGSVGLLKKPIPETLSRS